MVCLRIMDVMFVVCKKLTLAMPIVFFTMVKCVLASYPHLVDMPCISRSSFGAKFFVLAVRNGSKIGIPQSHAASNSVCIAARLLVPIVIISCAYLSCICQSDLA